MFSRSIRTFFFCPYKILVAVVKKFGSYPDDYHIHKNIADKLDPLNFSRVNKTVYSKALTVAIQDSLHRDVVRRCRCALTSIGNSESGSTATTPKKIFFFFFLNLEITY